MLDLLLVEDNDKLRQALNVGLEASGKVCVVYDCASGEEHSHFAKTNYLTPFSWTSDSRANERH